MPAHPIDPASDVASPTQKPGVSTTEFWISAGVTMATAAVAMLAALSASGLLELIPGDTDSRIVAGIVTVLTAALSVAAALGYNKGRALVKIEGMRAAAAAAASKPSDPS